MRFYEYKLTVQRVKVSDIIQPIPASHPQEIASLCLAEGIQDRPQEQMWVLHLNTKLEVIGREVVGMGGLTSSNAELRLIFSSAIVKGAAALVVVHNHPSGDPSPSSADVAITNQLVQAGQILGIRVLDHVIVGHDDRYYSFAENGGI